MEFAVPGVLQPVSKKPEVIHFLEDLKPTIPLAKLYKGLGMKKIQLSTTNANTGEPTTVITTAIKTVTTVTPVVSPSTTVLDFEDGVSLGLQPSSYFQGSSVAKASMVTNQYQSKGVVLEHAALANLGVGHAPSGTMAIVPVSSLGKVDYDAPVTLHFVKEIDTSVSKTVTQVANSTIYGEVKGNGKSIPVTHDSSSSIKNEKGANPVNDHNAEMTIVTETKTASATATTAAFVDGTVTFFSYLPDLDGRSFNTITLTAFALDGHMVGQVTVKETSNLIAPIVLTGLGEFHSVTIDSTLINKSWGGIAMDNVTIGEVHSAIQPTSQTDLSTSEVKLVGSYDPLVSFNPLLLVGAP